MRESRGDSVATRQPAAPGAPRSWIAWLGTDRHRSNRKFHEMKPGRHAVQARTYSTSIPVSNTGIRQAERFGARDAIYGLSQKRSFLNLPGSAAGYPAAPPQT